MVQSDSGKNQPGRKEDSDLGRSLITVIIPCYNSAAFIATTLASTLRQTYRELQVLCIDDGSKDETERIINEIAAQDPRVELQSKANGGIESALKYGLPFIKGTYTFLLGHDDTLSEDTLEKAWLAFEETPGLDAVRPILEFVHPDPTRTATMTDDRVLTGTEAFLDTIGGWKIHTFCLWRTQVFLKIDEVNTNGNFNFDELATRYLYLNCRLVGNCSGIYHYLQHPESVSKKLSLKRLQILSTDMLIRELLRSRGFYDSVAAKFEHYAALNLIGMINMYYAIAPEDPIEKKTAFDYFRKSYEALEKVKVLPLISGGKTSLWRLILSSFRSFMAYIRIKAKNRKTNEYYAQ